MGDSPGVALRSISADAEPPQGSPKPQPGLAFGRDEGKCHFHVQGKQEGGDLPRGTGHL